VNLVMAGALAAALRQPPLETLEAAAVELVGAKAAEESVRAAIREGHRWLT
jgi:Pyruvate/2-oxoacid:ferredoxin oxidoreductase gamma subunit